MDIIDAYQNEEGIFFRVRGPSDGDQVSIDVVVYRPQDSNFAEGIALYEQYIGAQA